MQHRIEKGLAYAFTSCFAFVTHGVTLIHARPFQPQAKGKQERWFRTVRTQLLPTLTDADTRDLEALNRRLWAWIEEEYWGSHCSSR